MKGVNAYLNLNETAEIKLNGNESYFDTNKEDQKKIIMKLDRIDLNRYPDDDMKTLRECYGEYAGVSANNIIAGNGSDEMISLIMGACLGKDKKVLALNPDFSMYDFYSSLYGAKAIKLDCNEDGSYKVEDFIEKGLEEKVDMVILSNPNNPTGYALEIAEIKKMLTYFKEIKVVIDEAYFEFNGVSSISLINKYKNLFVTRTLSKAWGLAALRVGFLISCKENIAKLNSYKVPYNISTLSQIIAVEMLKEPTRVLENSKAIIENREKLYEELKKIEKEAALEIKFYSSKGNYIFGRTPYKNILIRSLKDNGIIIRNFVNDDSFRITVGSDMQNKKVVNVLREGFVYDEK
ncbi:MAG: histidinol-phosphate transaminase [Clostridium sp.]